MITTPLQNHVFAAYKCKYTLPGAKLWFPVGLIGDREHDYSISRIYLSVESRRYHEWQTLARYETAESGRDRDISGATGRKIRMHKADAKYISFRDKSR